MSMLFEPDDSPVALAEGAWLLPGFARAAAPALLGAVAQVESVAPARRMVTRSGLAMSAAMTNAGALGWVSDRRGYRYSALDPSRDAPWPQLPPVMSRLARDAAVAAGFDGFEPDVCLINRYAPGARMGLHQDRDEADLAHPIVSVSLGLPAIFLWGGVARGDRTRALPLQHGDVVVFGGPSRLHFHGVRPVAEGEHPATGRWRINLTLRRAG